MANELDGFLTAASQRLGKEGALNASHAASSGRHMELSGVGRKHQAGLDELARSFIQAREGMTLNKDWGGASSGRRRRPTSGRRGRRNGSVGG